MGNDYVDTDDLPDAPAYTGRTPTVNNLVGRFREDSPENW